MNELQRQAYIRAMGFAPWVACAPLPGAAPTPVLAPAEPPAPPVAAVPEMPRQDPAPAAERPPLPTVSASPATIPPASPAEPARQATAGPRFTLQAFATPNVWLVLEQEQADAPGFGREAQQLVNNLLRIWQVGPGQPRRFLCPPGGQPLPADQAAQALGAFLNGLTRGGTPRVLLCAREDTAALVLPERFRVQRHAQGEWLAVSSLTEMLTQPAEHKRRTWQAMVGAGFHA